MSTGARSDLAERILAGPVLWVGLVALVVFAMAPFGWVALTSLKTRQELYATPLQYLPHTLSVSNYVDAWTSKLTPFSRFFANSLWVSSVTMVATTAISVLAGYAIARFRFGGGLLSIFLLVLRMLPAIALIIPLYLMYKALGLTNTYLGLVIVYTVVYIPFAVWLLVGFLRDFPVEIEEAAMIDGCSRLRALVTVVVPIIAPGMAVVALFAFIATWNEFLFAVVLTGIETKTMMVLVTSFTSGGTDMFYGEASASVVLGVLPAFAVAFLLQRYLVKGLALGGTKG
jgi:multiple sugar transport system permease protein